MSEQDETRIIDNAFLGFTQEAASSVRPADVNVVRAAVAHHQKIRRVQLSAAGALTMVLPVSIYLGLANGSQSPPASDPSKTPVTSLSASPSPSPSPTPSAFAPNQITGEALQGQLLDLPAMHCSRVGVPVDSAPGGPGSIWWETLVDPIAQPGVPPMTIALIHCEETMARVSQVLALRRAPDGKVSVYAPVFVNTIDGPKIDSIKAATGGGVEVTVSKDNVRQNRVFRWDGARFSQVSGPTTFPAAPPPPSADLQVQLSNLSLGEDVDGIRTGTVTVTVTNLSSGPSGPFQVTMDADSMASCGSCAGGYSRTDISALTFAASQWVQGTAHAGLPGGGSASVTVTMTLTRAHAFYQDRNIASAQLVAPGNSDPNGGNNRHELESVV